MPISVLFFNLPAILLISKASFSDSTLINKIFFFIASLIYSSVLPTPEKTILLGFIPDLIALSNSPPETTSAPDPSFCKTFKI